MFVFKTLFFPVKYISNIVTTLLALKNNPQCNATCCLEILQLVTDAESDVTNISVEPATSQDLFGNIMEGQDEDENNDIKKKI
jgi:hypothetical protein